MNLTKQIQIWRITVSRSSGIRLVVYCNSLEVWNVQLRSHCNDSDWEEFWKKKIAFIEFDSRDTASDNYRKETKPGIFYFNFFKSVKIYLYIHHGSYFNSSIQLVVVVTMLICLMYNYITLLIELSSPFSYLQNNLFEMIFIKLL